MGANVGTADRIARLVAGAFLIVLPFVATGVPLLEGGAARIALPAVGAVLAVTALVRFCPLYRLLGLRTCRS
jgi:hypothetical protein